MGQCRFGGGGGGEMDEAVGRGSGSPSWLTFS